MCVCVLTAHTELAQAACEMEGKGDPESTSVEGCVWGMTDAAVAMF